MGGDLGAWILLVEDDEAIAAFVATAMEREGYSVACVRTGREALSRVRQSAPGLVLLALRRVHEQRGCCECAYLPLVVWDY